MNKADRKSKIRPWDFAEHLKSEEDIAAYLEAALEDGDAAVVSAAFGNIARAVDCGSTRRRIKVVMSDLT